MTKPQAASPDIILKPRRAKPFFLRHPWVFSGAIGRVVDAPEKGSIVTVADSDGRLIGRGFYNPDSQIAVRLFSWDMNEEINEGFWRARLESAIRLREDVLKLPDSTDAYRLVFSDSDLLPGLIVDRYADYLVVEFLTAGMDAQRDLVLDLLMELAKPRGIYERGDDDADKKERMRSMRGSVRGEAPGDLVEIRQGELRFMVDIVGGQKTGFFLDQRDNRLAAAKYFSGRSVLDVFCYTGAFSVAACKMGGATEVLGLDSSEPALEIAKRNSELNGTTNFSLKSGRAADALRELKREGRTFGAVILDPPKFTRSRGGLTRALRAYRDLNILAMQMLEPEGILVTCSCSGHVSSHDFLMMLNDSANEAGVALQVLEQLGQSPDHPVIASCPETAYLKCFIGRVSRG